VVEVRAWVADGGDKVRAAEVTSAVQRRLLQRPSRTRQLYATYTSRNKQKNDWPPADVSNPTQG
jgi:hypothetical protein